MATAVQSRSAAAKTLAFSSSVGSGNLLLVAYSEGATTPAATISDTLGTSFELLQGDPVSGSGLEGYVWYGIAPSSGANTITITSASGTFPTLLIAEFSSATASLDSFQKFNNNTGFKIATSTDDDLVVTVILGNHFGDTFNTPSATTKLVEKVGSPADSAAIGYQNAASAGIQDIDLSMVQGRTDNIVIVASFLPPAAPFPSRLAPRQSAAGTTSAAFPISVKAGNLLVIGFGTNTAGTPTISDTLGTTYTHLTTATSGSNNGHFWYGVAPSDGANTVTISGSWTFPVMVIAEFVLSIGAALDTFVTSALDSGYTVTTTADYDGLITLICSNHNYSYTVASGCIQVVRTPGGTFLDTAGMGYQNGGTAGSQTSGFSGLGTDNAAFFVAFKVGTGAISAVYRRRLDGIGTRVGSRQMN